MTIAEVLRQAGYFTAMAGKWHLGQQNGSPPWQRGFDRVLNIRAGGIFFPNQNFKGGDELTKRGQEPLYLDGRPIAHDSPELGQNWYTTYLWTDFALKLVDEAKKAGKPFFLYIPHNAPHFPLMAPPELIAKDAEYKAGWDRLRGARYRRQVEMGVIQARWPLSPREPDSPAWDSLSAETQERFDQLMAVYAAMIEAIDTSVGTLVEGLRARGTLDDTLIVFLSDNGGNAESGPGGRVEGSPPGGPDSNLYLGMNWAALTTTPFRRFKHFTHEGGIATPLIAHWPQGIRRRNALEHQPGHLVDLMPTIVDVTGATYPGEFKGRAIQPMEGVSLHPAFAGGRIGDPADLLGARRESRDSLGQVEARVAVPGWMGALRHDRRPGRTERRGTSAPRRRQKARGRMGGVGQTRQRGSVAGAAPDELGRSGARKMSRRPWSSGQPERGEAGRESLHSISRASDHAGRDHVENQ